MTCRAEGFAEPKVARVAGQLEVQQKSQRPLVQTISISLAFTISLVLVQTTCTPPETRMYVVNFYSFKLLCGARTRRAWFNQDHSTRGRAMLANVTSQDEWSL